MPTLLLLAMNETIIPLWSEEHRALILEAEHVEILVALQQDARASVQQLAERTGRPATSCWRRLRELTDAGIVRRHATLLDAQRVGIGEVVFARVRLSSHQDDTVRRFEREVMAREDILECYPLMGDADYLLKVAVPGVPAYNDFLQGFLLKLPGIAQVESSFALREVKNDPALPLHRYLGAARAGRG